MDRPHLLETARVTMMPHMAQQFLVLFLVLTLCAVAQDGTLDTTIQSPGMATVEDTPEYVEFWLHRRATGPNYQKAMERVLRFESELTHALESQQLIPAEIEVLGVAIPVDGQSKREPAKLPPRSPYREVNRSARLRFTLMPLSLEEDRVREFVGLCDVMDRLTDGLECALEGPFLGIRNAEELEQLAVARAIENAYPVAEGAAGVLRAKIIAVQDVGIDRVEWNNSPALRAEQPNLSSVTCTAYVTVTYTLPATAP